MITSKRVARLLNGSIIHDNKTFEEFDVESVYDDFVHGIVGDIKKARVQVPWTNIRYILTVSEDTAHTGEEMQKEF